ncbi:prolyl 4-hydroxylase subunit alpha-2-like [Paramacrobiotus metropolitanus]|uniref:prolyl 4-hydroxylase subunit alpha-2-like n=1 Tax=Paramacrobiotus metropolitanus TaxID=2943436 RepID=UPI002445C9EB|nr:prolyl 4-hydroxylase subunit alpha-2-like [Paramacrobiotus metropolitanus]
MICWWSLFLLILAINISSNNGDVFTSMADVGTLVGSAQRLTHVLQELVRAEKERIQVIEKFVKEQKEFNQNLLIRSNREGNSAQLYHPITAFRFVKHLGVDWQYYSQLIGLNLAATAVDEVKRLSDSHQIKLPVEDDLKGASEALVRLQHTYDLDEDVVASGDIPGVPTKTKNLTSVDCFLLGINLAHLHFHDYAHRWLNLSLSLYEKEDKAPREFGQPQLRKAEILDWLQHSVYNHGDAPWALELSEQLLKLDPEFPNVKENIQVYKDFIASKNLEGKPADNKQKLVRGGHYERLCRGEGQLNKTVLSLLRCFYETWNNPSLLLQPLKFEMAYTDPEIYIIHDVALNSQIERVKLVSRKHMKRAMVVKAGTGDSETARIRISKSAFIAEQEDPVIGELNRRIGQVTNLNMEVAENLQMANYGIGGHYDAHFDHFRTLKEINYAQMHENWGDRIATLLVYLSDVEAGGATVFPRLNVTLYPQRGSAAFWYNLHRDGLGNENMLHAGCPVLSGVKWISNKWIREKFQDPARPCGLQPDSPEWVDGWPDPPGTEKKKADDYSSHIFGNGSPVK